MKIVELGKFLIAWQYGINLKIEKKRGSAYNLILELQPFKNQ